MTPSSLFAMSQRLLSALLLTLCLAHSPAQASEKDTTVRILTVGNSFARDALRFLPDMAAAGGRKLVLCTANVASASLEYHVRGIETFETDPGNQRGHPYTVSSVQLPYVTDPADPKVCPYDDKRRASLRELLEFEKWNYITIHQKSALSYDPASYEPSAGTLIAYIRKYAPQAEILVHQTWAYREDHPAFADGSGFNQQKMFEAVRQAYQILADRYHLRQVPVGEAFQAARATPRWTFTPDRTFDFANPPQASPLTKPVP